MSLGDALYEACRVVRDGGALDPSEMARAVAERRLETALPQELGSLQALLDSAFSDFGDAVAMLQVACAEEMPELAQWAMEKSLSGRDSMRRLRQLVEEYSLVLCEEADDGDF